MSLCLNFGYHLGDNPLKFDKRFILIKNYKNIFRDFTQVLEFLTLAI